MRILYHHRTASRDGQAVHIDELINAFERRGHELRIVGPAAGEAMGFGEENRLISLLKRSLPGVIYELLELGYSLLTAIRLRREYRKFEPDVFYERYNLFSPAGAWLRKRHRIPYLLEVNAPLAEERQKYGDLKLQRLAQWSQRYAWQNADRVLPVTRVLADHLIASDVSDKRIVVIRNGINRSRFNAQGCNIERRRELGLTDILVLGFTGFVREWHGLDEVIRALPSLGRSDVHLLIVGDGPGRAPLESLATELGLSSRVHFTGLVERHEIADYVACFDIALQPSVTPYASPLKIFEYMVLGKAIVAPQTPNIQEILVDGESARLFDPAVTGSLRDAIKDLCDDPALRQRLADGARSQIDTQQLTWDDNARRIEELTLDVIAELA
ncbi:MAG: glycosyltransferase family 4 protein [Gammaproteobacteria bacterium]|nr:glycosyltransferase family 4 protein [Gammaproteobacteria bacterium]MDH3767770.1 glycosyltransferase family 4 protein [Gammaproteobacteria bacterium]